MSSVLALGRPLLDLHLERGDAAVRTLERALPRDGSVFDEGGLLSSPETARVARLLRRDPHLKHGVLGGGAYNTLRLLAELGTDCGYCGVVGRDAAGRAFHGELRFLGVRNYVAVAPSFSTGFCIRVADRPPLVGLGAAGRLSSRHLPITALRSADLLYIEGFLLPNQRLIECLLARALRGSRPPAVWVDLGSPHAVHAASDAALELLAHHAEVVLGTAAEWRALAQHPPVHRSIVERGALCCEKHAAEGAVLKQHMLEISEAAPAVPARDPTGAGDILAAVLMYALGAHPTPEDSQLRRALRVAVQAASASVACRGGRLDPCDRVLLIGR